LIEDCKKIRFQSVNREAVPTRVEFIPVLKNDLLGTIVTEFEVDSVSKIAKVLSIRWKLRPKPQN